MVTTWTIEYYEQTDGVQPAEVFEDALTRDNPKLSGKLRRIFVAVLEHGRQLGGGLVEPLHGYPSLWEARAISNDWLAREFFAWDGETAILLHGYIKRVGQKAPQSEMDTAQVHWQDYAKRHCVSPEAPEAPEEPQQLGTVAREARARSGEAAGREQTGDQTGAGKKGKKQRR